MSQRRNLDGSCGAIQRYALTYVLLLCGCLFGLLGSNLAFAAPPPANSTIGNQASASYTDASGTIRTALSNLVQTTVQQVYSHTLMADMGRIVAPGGTAYLSHTLTNTGNGTDTYVLSVAQLTTDNFDLSSVTFYADANGDGQPDNFTPITSTGALQAGQSFQFVVAGGVPLSGVANNNTAQIRVGAVGTPSDANNYTASTTAPTGSLQGNTDTVTVSTGSAISMTKAYSVTSGPSNNTLHVTLTFTNTGTVAAAGVQVADTIGGAGNVAGTAFDTREMAYVAGSAKINGVVKTDNSDADELAVTPDATSGGQKVAATISVIPPGGTGTMSFDVTVTNATPGAEKTTNVASYLVGSTTLTTNSVRYVVPVVSTAGVAVGDSRVAGATGGSANSNRNNLNGSGAGGVSDGNSTTDPRDAQAVDNGVLLASVPQGATPVFHVIVTNTGFATDRFDLAIAGPGNTYPAGTTFSFLDAAGVPFTDSNSDGVPDTGPLTPNTAVDVFVRVSPPVTSLAPSGGWSAKVLATSVNNVSMSDQTPITVDGTSFTKRTVDLRNNSATGPGAGFASGDLNAISVTSTANPGQNATISLWVTNGASSISDSFDLQAFGGYTVNAAGADTTTPVPSGWSVKFVATGQSAGGASCPAAGTTVTNTGLIAPGGSCEYNAVIAVPAGQLAGTTAFYFRAWSPLYGVDSDNVAGYDVIHDAVTTNELSAISLAANGAKQVYPGNYVEFPVKLCNSGNTAVTTAGTTITSAHSQANFTNTLVVDTNGDGHADPADQAYVAVTNGQLTPGQCVNLVNKVLSPAAAAAGTVDVTTLTATATAGSASVTATVTDSVTVVTTTLSLFKEQSTVDCSTGVGVGPQASFTSGNITNTLAPGACIRYRITATNIGTSTVTGVTISDTTPAYTTFNTTGGCAVSTAGDTAGTPGGTATNGNAGTVTSTVASLDQQKTSQLLYCVKLNQ